MNKQRLAILIASSVGAFATFLPWVNVPLVGSIPGTSGNGWITFGLFLIPIAISLVGDTSKRITSPLLLGALLPSMGAALFGLWKILSFYSEMGEIEDNPFSQAIKGSIGIGLFLVVIAGILIPILDSIITDGKTT